MKQIVVLSLFALFVVGCGSSQNTGLPAPKGPVAAQPGVGGGGAGQWDANTFQAAVQYCAASGDPSFSYQQWTQFCTCAYSAAASQWSFQDFYYNFQYYYGVLQSQGILNQCLHSAQMAEVQQQSLQEAMQLP